jgi:multiple sugar transport system permease protein
MRTRRQPGTWATITVFLLWSLLPLYWLINTSLKAPTDTTSVPPRWLPSLDISAYTTALSDPGLRGGLLHSLYTAFGATIISVGCGLCAGFALTHLATRRTDRYEFWVLTSRMAPPIAVALPFFLMYRALHLQDTTIGLILAHVVLVAGIVTWILVETCRALSPQLLEAALVDGAGYGKAFTAILLPLAMPGVVGAASIAFLLSWNDFFLSLILTDTKAVTAPLSVYQAVGFQNIDLGQLSATSTIVLIPTALVVGFFQKQLVAGLTMGAVKE